MRYLPRMLCLSLLASPVPVLAAESLSSLPSGLPPTSGVVMRPASSPTLPLPTQPTWPAQLPAQLPGALPGLPSELAPLPVVTPERLPAAGPTPAVCQFKTPQANLNFGAIPSGAASRSYAQPVLLQVECRQAADFRFSTTEPAIATGSAAERSSLLLTLRGPDGRITGSAWVRLEQDGQPLAARRYSVPASSPTLIAATALLVASPTSERTPVSSGTLDSLVLARQLYLSDGSAP